MTGSDLRPKSGTRHLLVPLIRINSLLHDLLLDYGTPVQYSVFECLVNEKEEKRLHKSIRRVIRPRKDAVRFYHLCADCVAKTVITSGVELTTPPAGAVVVG